MYSAEKTDLFRNAAGDISEILKSEPNMETNRTSNISLKFLLSKDKEPSSMENQVNDQILTS